MASNQSQQVQQNPSPKDSSPKADVKSPLLHAWHDPLANIHTNQSCVKLVDLNCDGDSKLCVCDYDKKLRVYKGTNMVMEYAVLDVPIAICVAYMETSLPRMPSIAVAAGFHVFIYRQMRPYRKWTCPPVEIAPAEAHIWADLRNDSLTSQAAIKRMTDLRDQGTPLSSRALELLAIDHEAARANLIAEMKETPPTASPSIITCMEGLKKESEEAVDAVTLLVVGTEAGQLLILPQDPMNSTTICKLQLPSPPALMVTGGCFDVEWRVSVVCRDNRLYSVKNGEIRNTAVLVGGTVDLGAACVALVRQEKLLWAALMDRTLHCYSARGKRLKSTVMSEDITELCVLPLKRPRNTYLLLVALINGEIQLLRDGILLHSLKVDPPVTAVTFGMYGREENSLCLVHGPQGSLTIKIWRRTAVDLEPSANSGTALAEQEMPLNVPKKTRLYVEQAAREREQAAAMHRAFQRDLCKLRLTTARAYVKTLTEGLMGVTGGGLASVSNVNSSAVLAQELRLQVAAQGLGPTFLLRITLQNTGNTPVTQLRVLFAFDPRCYVMGHEQGSAQCLAVPLLLPGPRIILETRILCIDPAGRGGQLMCLLYQTVTTAAAAAAAAGGGGGGVGAKESVAAVSLLTAAVKMPPAEPLL